jgi:iron complex outermembrane receptor protein
VTPPYSQTGLSSDAEYAGGNLLTRWVRPVGAFGEIQLQTYYDRTQLDFGDLEEARDTVDLDLRHRFAWGERQSITWGGGYRYSGSDFHSSFEIGLDPGERTYQVFNVFLQDEVALVPDRWILTLGTKVEHNTYTGFEVEPGARLAWLITPRQTLWGAVARAVRTPSDMERDGRINLEVLPPSPPTIPLPTLVSLLGSPDSEAETMIAYELGYRSQVTPRLSLDVALFLNDYDQLRGSVRQAPSIETEPAPHFLASSLFGNQAEGQSYGGELAVTWQTTDWLRFQAAYSLFLTDLNTCPGASSLEVETDASAPRHKAYLRSMVDLPQNLDLDLWLRYNGTVEGVSQLAPSLTTTTIPEYLTLDARLSWRPTDHWEFTVAGQNLFGKHQEFFPTFVSSETLEVEPSVYGRVTFRF